MAAVEWVQQHQAQVGLVEVAQEALLYLRERLALTERPILVAVAVATTTHVQHHKAAHNLLVQVVLVASSSGG